MYTIVIARQHATIVSVLTTTMADSEAAEQQQMGLRTVVPPSRDPQGLQMPLMYGMLEDGDVA